MRAAYSMNRTLFQWLELFELIFPMVGTFRADFSNGWKTATLLPWHSTLDTRLAYGEQAPEH
jgi:hypothetical protein